MSQLLFLNENTYGRVSLSQPEVRAVTERFIDMLLALKKLMPKAALVSGERLSSIRIGKDQISGSWINSVAKDRSRAILALANHAPFRSVSMIEDKGQDLKEYRFDGSPFDRLPMEGAGLAHLFEGLAIGIDEDSKWRLHSIPLVLESLENDCVVEHKANVRNLYQAPNGSTEACDVLDIYRKECISLSAMWKNRSTFFPKIDFHPKTENDLFDLPADAFKNVVAYLSSLDRCLHGWKTDAVAPSFPPHTTDEGKTRKNLFYFSYNKNEHCFSRHGRYTPGAGRIHFVTIGQEKRAIIGYIGYKVSRKITRE